MHGCLQWQAIVKVLTDGTRVFFVLVKTKHRILISRDLSQKLMNSN